MNQVIDFRTDPTQYRHWRIEYDGAVATLFLDVDEDGALFDGYQLKLNSYDLGVDIELADIVQRMRFEHPEVVSIIVKSGKERVFCAGANIRMLGGASHDHKVNFCKFTNETRNALESAGKDSDQHYLAAIKGACAGGGYEIALACEEIYLAEDGSSSVALPEVPLLAVLPGTGGLTRVLDKRKVRRDLADVFCTLEEGVRGQRALEWNLVDQVVANSTFDEHVGNRASELAADYQRSRETGSTGGRQGIPLLPIDRTINDASMSYSSLTVTIDRGLGIAYLDLHGPDTVAPASLEELHSLGTDNWLLKLARELDDAILHLRFNETTVGSLVFRSSGDPEQVRAHENVLLEHHESDWLSREILLLWKRVFQRIDLTSRSLIVLIEHGSCFHGLLAEIVLAADRSYMMDGEFEDNEKPHATLSLSLANLSHFPMPHGLTRLNNRFFGTPEKLNEIEEMLTMPVDAKLADKLGLVTFIYDDIDWEDEIRIFLEERRSFSPDALTAMEANLRFAGPESMESRIFGRLSAWQNWIFQRPNAVGETGALQRYGSGQRGEFDRRRV